ncbi:putative transmembrane protein [Burkholderiales bacterium]|jgi:hypothetical protein|nr:putative transmembrane protein [Burkholderiales bacterium]
MSDESVASSSKSARRMPLMSQLSSPARQRGLSLISLIFVGVIVVFLLAIGMKVVPALAEYLAVERAVQKAAQEGQTVRDIRAAFDRYCTIDDIKSITGKDLDVTKDADRIVVSYAYSYSVPVLDNVRIVIDFSGSNRDHPGRAVQP